MQHKGTRLSLALVTVLMLTAIWMPAQEKDGPPPEFQQAYQLAAEKQYDQALKILDEILLRGENTRNALFSAGSIAMSAGAFEKARRYLLQLERLEPRSGKVRAALVRANQAIGDFGSRDQERSELFHLRQSGEDPELRAQEYFVRDDFSLMQANVTALEFFELRGDRALRYVFLVFRPDRDTPDYRISLGSYTATVAAWRATRKPKPKPDERLFHLDGYFQDGSHVTFGMHFPEPSYDAVREMVIKAIHARDGLRGHWTGSAQISGHAPVTTDVDLDRTAHGWEGSLSFPTQNASGIPLEAIDYSDGKFSFRAKGIPGDPTYVGILSADGKTIEGDYSEATGKFPFRFTRTGEPQVEVVKSSEKVSTAFVGDWEGAIRLARNYKVILRISNDQDGANVVLISVDEGRAEISGSIQQNGSALTIEVKPFGGHFHVKLENDGSELNGTMTQGGTDTPVRLKRLAQN